ncbi:site-specific integrase [Mangrovibacterium diazotrophicum]|uniref:Site-specific recombinase XerD n=1 Tax=Mangrovibacterium diazotrophicum TaxID=1261403 RepID=A0A419W5U9_9BACT|nr:site-specific integrase [Mangrovibacterium diazotrophicum]RKD90824.1 site-specific recombinase XerD [Mangrovibacterium diazotrophicum]
MNKINTFGIQFVIRKHRIKDGKAPIYARITVNTSRCELSVKRRVNIDNWSNGKGMAKGKDPDIARLNSYLEQVRSHLTNHYQDLIASKQEVTAETIKNRFMGISDSEKTLKELVEYHNSYQDENLKWGTLKNYFTTAKYIDAFLKKKYNKDDIYLSDLNYKFIVDFEYYLRKNKPTDHQRPMENNGVMKHLERFRKMINLAIRMEWLDHNPFAAHKLRFKKVEREFLTELELKSIEEKLFRIERLAQVKDIFLFSCYTGLAYIDVMKLGPSHIHPSTDGMNWIFTQREKTLNPVRIPILKQAERLIDKYKDDPKAISKGTLFPMISNQKLNSYLKEIADLCGITKNLTFHVARHTFATTVTLSNGVPIESVSKMLGHSDLRTTQIYAKVVEKKISNDMTMLQERLTNNQREKNPKQIGTKA